MRILLTAFCLMSLTGCTAMLLGDSNAGSYPSTKEDCSEKDGKRCSSEWVVEFHGHDPLLGRSGHQHR